MSKLLRGKLYKGLRMGNWMLTRAEYVNVAEFLPDTGVVYMDTCGLKFIGPGKQNDVGGLEVRAVRIKNFLDIFIERGNVVTTDGVISELVKDIDEFDKWREKKLRLLERGSVDDKWALLDDLECLDRYDVLYGKLFEFLGRNIDRKMRFTEGDEICDFVDNFVSRRRRKLSECDKRLVAAALNSGSGNGILTADGAMISAFGVGVKKFGLDGCFISHATESKTKYIRR
jgi:hypothetical protein